MFKFGFSSEDKEGVKNEDENVCKNGAVWAKSTEIVPNNKDSKIIAELLENTQINTITFCDVKIKYLDPHCFTQVMKNGILLDNNTILTAEQNHSDLLPAIYEGGLKIWECTYDLLHYINDNEINFENKRVLDLGCGAGLIGILSLLKGSICFFQDYNSDVIQYITVPNVLINTKENLDRCKFYSGDWQSFSELLETNITEGEKFDLILTSETIYNTDNFSKLHHVFEKLLCKNGTIFLAAKSFYFGVGGGITLFQDFLDQRKIFKFSSCWKHVEGIKREILKIQFNT